MSEFEKQAKTLGELYVYFYSERDAIFKGERFEKGKNNPWDLQLELCKQKWVSLEVAEKVFAEKDGKYTRLEGRILDGFFSLPEPEKWERDPYGFYPATVINSFVLGSILCYKPEQRDVGKFYWSGKVERLEDELAVLKGKLEAFIKTLIELTPVPQKITTYDPEAKEDWIIETADPQEYRRFYNWLDENVSKLEKEVRFYNWLDENVSKLEKEVFGGVGEK